MSKISGMKLLNKYVSMYKKNQQLVVSFALLANLSSIGIALSLKVIIDNGLMQKKSSLLVIGCIGYFLCAICNVTFSVLKEKNASCIGEGAICNLRKDMISHYLSLPALVQYKIKSGDLLTLSMKDTEGLKKIISTHYARKITNAITVTLILISMIYLNYNYFLIVICGMPVFLSIVFLFGNRLYDAEKRYMNAHESLNQVILQTASGAETVKHLNADQILIQNHRDKVVQLERSTRYKKNVEAMKNVSGNFFSVAFVGIFMVFGGYLLIEYKLSTPGIFVAFMTLIPALYNALVDSISLYLEQHQSTVNLERINRVFSAAIETNGKLDIVEGSVEIEIMNLCFSYEDKEVLKNINLKINQGEKIAIVGSSGSGKSTLAHILGGLLRGNSGKMLLNGNLMSDYTEEARAKIISMMEQEPFFFEDNIENIICGNSVYDFDRIVKVATEIGLHEDIEGLPEKYKNQLSEKIELSGGQKQRLALARLLYSESKILILDEPTSGLDKISQNNISCLFEGDNSEKTIIVITHNQGIVAKADRVISLVDGEIMNDTWISHTKLDRLPKVI